MLVLIGIYMGDSRVQTKLKDYLGTGKMFSILSALLDIVVVVAFLINLFVFWQLMMAILVGPNS
jgi:hypothetical protein